MTDCRICSGPVNVKDRDTCVIQDEGFQGFVCGHCMRDSEPAIPTRSWFDRKGGEHTLPPRGRA